MPILWPLKVPERGNAITQRKTLEIEHSCLFIHHTISIYPFPQLILFNTPKKSLLKSSYLNQIFVAKKSRNWKFQTQKNPSIIPVIWNPEYPPLGIVQSAINETTEGHSMLTIGYIYKDRKRAHLLLIGEKDGFSCTCKYYLPPILYQ